MKRTDELVGTPVISVEEGIEVGHVKGLIINSTSGQTAGIILSGQNALDVARVVPLALVQGFGDDAVVIENTSSVTDLTGVPELAANGKPDSEVMGMKVMTRDGFFLGTVEGLYADLPSGSITGYALSSPSGARVLPTDLIVNIGKQYIIVLPCDDKRLAGSAQNLGLEAIETGGPSCNSQCVAASSD